MTLAKIIYATLFWIVQITFIGLKIFDIWDAPMWQILSPLILTLLLIIALASIMGLIKKMKEDAS